MSSLKQRDIVILLRPSRILIVLSTLEHLRKEARDIAEGQEIGFSNENEQAKAYEELGLCRESLPK